MLFFLTNQPLWLSGLMVVGLGALLSMLGPALVRRHVDIKRLGANNEVAGFKFATIGVLYAVLLAFAIIVVWQKFSDAEVDVVQGSGCRRELVSPIAGPWRQNWRRGARGGRQLPQGGHRR